jgi:hypothetical protein
MYLGVKTKSNMQQPKKHVFLVNKWEIYIQEDHDGPEIAHLYKGLWAKANFKPGAFIWTILLDTN